MSETYEEWRVTGTFVDAFTGVESWYEDTRANEFQARDHLAFVRDADLWTDGPHLHKRTVTVTDWEACR